MPGGCELARKPMCLSGVETVHIRWDLNPWAGTQTRPEPRLGLEPTVLTEIKPWSQGFPSGSDGKESVCTAGDWGSTPGLGRSPGEGNCNPLQYCGLENSMDRGAWWATVHGVAKSRTQPSD